MKTQYGFAFKRAIPVVFIVVFFAATSVANATTHVVQFGGSLGYIYSPDSMNVSVGDTIQWEGDFSMHPLSSTSVPAGAASFHQGSGSVFSYPVAVAGTYLYHCDFHFSIGMKGTFIASASTAVENTLTSSQPHTFKLDQNFPNPFNPSTKISFDIPFQTFVSLKVYNIVGKEVAMIMNGNMAAGSYSKTWNAESMPSGIYFYKLTTAAWTDIKKMVLLK